MLSELFVATEAVSSCLLDGETQSGDDGPPYVLISEKRLDRLESERANAQRAVSDAFERVNQLEAENVDFNEMLEGMKEGVAFRIAVLEAENAALRARLDQHAAWDSAKTAGGETIYFREQEPNYAERC